MPRVIWTDAATKGLLRAFLFLDKQDKDAAEKALNTILAGTKILERFPNAGRPADDLEHEQKELLIPFGSAGYVALYEVEGENVYILALRHQRDVGY
jgi:plasmid stabilization system protein ParE